MNIKIITDSCCDLPLSFVEDNADLLTVLGMPIQIAGRCRVAASTRHCRKCGQSQRCI